MINGAINVNMCDNISMINWRTSAIIQFKSFHLI